MRKASDIEPGAVSEPRFSRCLARFAAFFSWRRRLSMSAKSPTPPSEDAAGAEELDAACAGELDAAGADDGRPVDPVAPVAADASSSSGTLFFLGLDLSFSTSAMTSPGSAGSSSFVHSAWSLPELLPTLQHATWESAHPARVASISQRPRRSDIRIAVGHIATHKQRKRH